MAGRDRIQQLKAEIAASEGWQLQRQFVGLGRSYRTFLGNDDELRAYLNKKSELAEALELWDRNNSAGFDRFLDEVDRLLHNYLAAAGTLREHGRNVWQAHAPDDPALQIEYTRRVDACFTSSDLVQFVHRLRNYTLHSRLPIAQGHLRGTPESFESRVVLPRQELRRWSGWTTAARRYLDAAPEDIGLLDVVDEYTQAVRDFNEWSGPEFVRGHLRAFEELAALQQKLLAAQTFG